MRPAPTATPDAEAEPTPTPVPVVSISRPGSGETIFQVPAMQPGDVAIADVLIANDGTADFTYTLTVEATTSSLLDADPVNGLQMAVLRCGASYGLSCSQTPYSGPAIAAQAPMGGPQTVGTGGAQRGLRPSTQDYVEMRFSIPTATGNAFQSQTSVLRFTWTATHAP
jgi:hypothetical protein